MELLRERGFWTGAVVALGAFMVVHHFVKIPGGKCTCAEGHA
ncbi:MAG: hypothetical protein ACYCV4_05485 [Dermatophilaceae bacterium]